MSEVSEDDFAQRFNQAADLHLARLVRVSLPTIRRWREGKTSPHPLIREPIFSVLETDAEPIEKPSLFRSVAKWCDAIQDHRSIRYIFKSVKDEVQELEDEIDAREASRDAVGADGVFGEAIDVLASIIDILRHERPNLSLQELEDEVTAYAEQKCEKWARKTAEGAYLSR